MQVLTVFCCLQIDFDKVFHKVSDEILCSETSVVFYGVSQILDKYEKIADRTGIKAQREKMSIIAPQRTAANAAIRNTHTILKFNPNASFEVKLESFDSVVNK